MDGRVSKSNLRNFRTKAPAVNNPSPAKPSGTQVPTPSKPASIVTGVPSAASSSTPSKPVAVPAPVTRTTSNAGISPARNLPNLPALQKQLNAAQATFRVNQATPVQSGTHRAVPRTQQMPMSTPTVTPAKLPTVQGPYGYPPFSYPYAPKSLATTLPPSTTQQNVASPPLNFADRLSLAYPQQYPSAVPSSPEQITQTMFQRFAPVLASIDTQVSTLNQMLKSDRTMRDLEKDREAKELEREARDKALLKALSLVAEKTSNIEAAIGVEGIARTALSDRLGKLEMNLEECLERLRDPKADGMDVDEADTTPAAPATPVVRHDVAVSPIMRPVPIAKTYASVQVGTSLAQIFVTTDVSDTQAPSKDISRNWSSSLSELSSSNAEPEPPKAIGTSSGGGVVGVDANSTNNNQAKEPLSVATPTKPNTQQQQHRNDGPGTPATRTPRSWHMTPSTPSKQAVAPVGSFSPVDWSKPIASSPVTKNPTSAVAAFSHALKHRTSYVLPAVPEGTIAALRKDALGDPYPYSLPSITLSGGSGDAAAGAGASVSSSNEPVVAPHLTLFDVLPEEEDEDEEDEDEEEDEEEEEDELIDDAIESKQNPEPKPQKDGPSPAKSQVSGVTEDENAVARSLVMDERAGVDSPDPMIVQDGRDVVDGPPSPPASSVIAQSSKVGQSPMSDHPGSSGPKGKSTVGAAGVGLGVDPIALYLPSPSPAAADCKGTASKPGLLPSSTPGEHHEIKKDGVRNEEESSSSSSQIPSAGKTFPEATTGPEAREREYNSPLSAVELEYLFESPAKEKEKKKDGKKRQRSLSVITISSDSEFRTSTATTTTARSKKHATTTVTSGNRRITSVKKGGESSGPTAIAAAAAGSGSGLSLPGPEKRRDEAKKSSDPATAPQIKKKKVALFDLTSSESELTSLTPTPTHARTAELARIRKLISSLDDDDDDAVVVPFKRHKAPILLSPSTSTSNSLTKVKKTDNGNSSAAVAAVAAATTTSTTNATKKILVDSPSDSSVVVVPEFKIPKKKRHVSPDRRAGLVSLSDWPIRKKGPSVAVTRVKKRKAPEDLGFLNLGDDDEIDVLDQPPLKRAKLKAKNKTLERTAMMTMATPPKKKKIEANEMPSGSGSKSKSKSDDNGKGKGNGSNKSPSIVQWEPSPATAGSSSSRTPTKRIRGSQPRAASVLWPKIDKPTFEQFIECDICDRWYHVGCVGLRPRDILLSGSESYHCPLCKAGSNKDALSPQKNKTGSAISDCSRPKCLRPILKSNAGEGETYIVEAFLGMRKKSIGARGLQIQYLVKWFGYEYRDATWETEQKMGLPNSGVFIEKFEKAAKKEKLDISRCNQEAVVLECAARAGWNAQGLYLGK